MQGADASIWKLLFDYAPLFGAVVGGTVLLLGAIGRLFGITGLIGNKSKLVDDGQLTAVTTGIADIKSKLDGMESRMSVVEHELPTRATKEEVHRLEIAVTKMEIRFESLASNVQSIGNGVHRIEEFMYDAALKGRQGN